jgi:hypothetical protein
VPQREDEAATIGFELRTLLRRYDRMHAAMDSWTADLDFEDKDEVRNHERDLRHDEVLGTRDALLVSTLRLVRFFVFDEPRTPEELEPRAVVPGWEPPEATATRLRSFLEGMTLEATRLSGTEKTDWPFALILATLLDVAESFGWALGAYDPDAARHFDHNIAELRDRLR